MQSLESTEVGRQEQQQSGRAFLTGIGGAFFVVTAVISTAAFLV
jgi:hypothetical protein